MPNTLWQSNKISSYFIDVHTFVQRESEFLHIYFLLSSFCLILSGLRIFGYFTVCSVGNFNDSTCLYLPVPTASECHIQDISQRGARPLALRLRLVHHPRHCCSCGVWPPFSSDENVMPASQVSSVWDCALAIFDSPCVSHNSGAVYRIKLMSLQNRTPSQFMWNIGNFDANNLLQQFPFTGTLVEIFSIFNNKSIPVLCALCFHRVLDSSEPVPGDCFGCISKDKTHKRSKCLVRNLHGAEFIFVFFS